MFDDVENIRRILVEKKVIAVVGLSANWWRPSFFAAKYMQDHGYRIIPVNPNYEEILGETCYPSLEAIPKDIGVEIVDVFQKPEAATDVAKSALAIGARVLWLQIGVINEEAKQIAEHGGLDVVMNRCVKIEHGRLLGGLNLFGVSTKVISARRPRWLVY
ncbi:MAG TPA: CoA-binding protein [Gammaproteobacteria bacterium]|jgi:predicted CoA-binding protein|nr:CoA-binding protein [Acidiferrobacteraceae bacterium]MDP6398532.1 CoA-binding protein [Arenicellales bacterium]HCX87048.1 CoA-binding protein [Gammaproteobacteria bacterium]MDP6552769.1 CoA-binding protein [Arenicellales bacterium]MDP6791113.1 CoA-binding protein [Arenicellales bacterium]|tara:strand:+ start:1781 stop:2260 length:480 start_codon:yes stop_codon:yes gene_type:complete